MPSPYTISESSTMTGLSVKFIRRLKDALPNLFEKHTDRGQANALLFDEEIVEVLKRIRELKKRGQTLNQIKKEISQYVEKRSGAGESNSSQTEASGRAVFTKKTDDDPLMGALQRENDVLHSQINLLQELIRKAEDRFDRLLPEGKIRGEKKSSAKWQLVLWLTEAIVVTTFASGFIFLIWLFAQKAFEF